MKLTYQSGALMELVKTQENKFSKLKGKPPTEVRKRLKAFFYGDAGTGKSTCALGFPKPYLIDTERGSEHEQYQKILADQGGVIFQSRDYNEIFEQIKALASEKHDYQTIIIDPITSIWNNVLHKYEEKMGAAKGRHYGYANKDFERMIDLLLRIDMNVIITSHAKKEYGKDMEIMGNTFDAYSKIKHIFDLVIETKVVNRKFIGVIKKTRVTAFPIDSEIEFNSKVIMEGGLVKKIDSFPMLISDDTYGKLMQLVDCFNIEQKQIDTWLTKAMCFDLRELSETQGSGLISMLLKRYAGKAEEVVG